MDFYNLIIGLIFLLIGIIILIYMYQTGEFEKNQNSQRER